MDPKIAASESDNSLIDKHRLNHQHKMFMAAQ